MSSNPININRVEYSLQHEDYPTLVITEPIGWKSDEMEFSRHEDYHGMVINYSNSLRYVGSGAKFITLIYETYDINAQLLLRRRERHPQTNAWTTTYIGYLDLSTYEISEGQVSCKFNSSGLIELLKSKESEKIEIERTDTLDGSPLEPLTTQNVHFEGRRIFLKSVWSYSDTNDQALVSIESNAGNTRAQTAGLPVKIVSNSHIEMAQSVTPETTGTELVGDKELMFMFDNNRDRIFKIDLSGRFDAVIDRHQNVDWGLYWVCLTVYKDGFSFNTKVRIPLYRLEDVHPYFGGDFDYELPPFTFNNITFSYFNENFELLAGESLALEVFVKADFHTNIHAGLRVYAVNFEGSIDIEENSVFPETIAKTILNHDLGKRLVKIITGKDDNFYSEAMGRTDIGYNSDGIAALMGHSHGQWIRGFDKFPESEENKYKAFTTSFKDWMENNKVVWNLGLGVELVGYKERIRIEDQKFFYNNNVLIKIGKVIDGEFVYTQVKKVKRAVAKEHYYSGLQIGYQKGWENEEAMGLDEYNSRTDFTTAITKLKKSYLKVSKYIGAVYPKEFIRRKPISQYPTTDHRYDTNIFIHDLKRFSDNLFHERKWEDDFEEAPTGVFSPETASNLRFSPVNILLRHAWVIAGSLTKYLGDYIRYGGSEGNSKMKTKLIGGVLRSENGDGDTTNVIKNSDLERARFVPQWVEFEHIVDFELMQQIRGKTMIDGKEVPNFYGLVQYRNEFNQLEKGYLFNLKPNDSGKWKILKANR